MANKQFADANNIKELWVKIRQTFLRQSDASNTYATKEENALKANSADLANVATSGSYNDLSNTPTIPNIAGLASETYVTNAIQTSENSLKGEVSEDYDTLKELVDKKSETLIIDLVERFPQISSGNFYTPVLEEDQTEDDVEADTLVDEIVEAYNKGNNIQLKIYDNIYIPNYVISNIYYTMITCISPISTIENSLLNNSNSVEDPAIILNNCNNIMHLQQIKIIKKGIYTFFIKLDSFSISNIDLNYCPDIIEEGASQTYSQVVTLNYLNNRINNL